VSERPGFPERGVPAGAALEQLAGFRSDDVRWRDNRVFSLVYTAGDELHDVLQQAHDLYLFENALNVEAFPSLRRIQGDLTAAVADLLNGGDTAAGFTTSGGTESILMAVKAARDWGRAERGIEAPEMVLPTSAHAAFAKASHYFGVRSVRVDVGPDYRADVDAMAGAVGPSTVLVVGSAPTYPQGVVDPIADLAALAADRGILCHVDACMGGFLLPFLERLGRFDTPWDFRVPGVTSISADVHKYGYAVKGVSTVTYRTRELRRYQAFTFDQWLGGAYGSPSMPGTRPAGPLAAAWAAVHHLGLDGYTDLVRRASDAAATILEGVRSLPALRVVGEPEATLLAVAAAEDSGLDVFAVGEALRRRGWYTDRQTPPDSLHLTVHAGHAAPVCDEFVADLRAAVDEVARAGGSADDRATTYGTVE
jgi:glutamate/tyrosine decarboxylase-like PLP-dependent enzyme